MCTSSCRGRGQKRALDSLELELQLSITQVPPTCLPSSSPYSFFHTGSQVVQAELTMDVKVTLYVVLGNSRPCACWHGLHVLKCILTLTSEPLSNHSIALIPNHTVDSSLWRTSLSRSTSTAAPARLCSTAVFKIFTPVGKVSGLFHSCLLAVRVNAAMNIKQLVLWRGHSGSPRHILLRT